MRRFIETLPATPAAATAVLAVTLAGMTAAPPPAEAGFWRDNERRVGIWMFVRKAPDEELWEACRRVYGRDVYRVRGAGPRKARCYVDSSQIYNPGGFYRRDGRD
jgi:hypothetical protein